MDIDEGRPLTRTMSRKVFRTIKETYYLATPYLMGARVDLGYSLRQMADAANVSLSFYHDFERGKVKAKIEFVKKVLSVLKRPGKGENYDDQRSDI